LDANSRASNRNLRAHLFDVTISYSRVLAAIELSGDVQIQVFHTRGANRKQGRGKYYSVRQESFPICFYLYIKKISSMYK
jgi:hypothetical protein